MNLADPATAGRDGQDTGLGSVFVSNYPPFSTWSPEELPAAQQALEGPPRPDTDFGLYLPGRPRH
jgi:oxygen-independent coproporphyrinogen-3 oxidase